ncbi:MAG: transferase [Planctomycetota bacterium]|nr:MAG: transferase [Planctomycetota bacterium]
MRAVPPERSLAHLPRRGEGGAGQGARPAEDFVDDERTEVAVVGAGPLGRELVAALGAGRYRVVAVFDDEALCWTRAVLGVPVRPLSAAEEGPGPCVLAVEDNRERRRLAEGLEVEWLSLVHPFSWVAPTASLGPGAIVCAGAVVQPDAVLGPHAVVGAGALVGVDARLEAFARLGPGVRLAYGCWLGEGALVGAGAVLSPHLRMGAWSVVGEGAVVCADLADEAVADGRALAANETPERAPRVENAAPPAEDAAPPAGEP